MFLFSLGNIVNAQDFIYTKSNDTVLCVITLVNKSFIFYKTYDNKKITHQIEKDKVRRIVWKNGSTLVISKDEIPPVDYNSQKKNIIKLYPASPIFGKLAFGYERSIAKQMSIELTYGIIGIGSDFNEHKAKGQYFRLGYKFMRNPDVYFNTLHYSHILKGSFIRPDFIYSSFSSNEYRDIPNPVPGGDLHETYRASNHSIALFIVIGKQWILKDKFSVSVHTGLGYSYATASGYYFSHFSGGKEEPIGTEFGFSIGFLL